MTDKTKAIHRLTISRNDLEQCILFLEQLPNHEYGSIAYEALLLSAIICYARPFSCNEKGKNAKANAKIENEVLNKLTKEELELHSKLLILRNKAIAHAEWSYYPTSITEKGTILSKLFSIRAFFSESGDIHSFSELARKILLRAHHLTADKLIERP